LTVINSSLTDCNSSLEVSSSSTVDCSSSLDETTSSLTTLSSSLDAWRSSVLSRSSCCVALNASSSCLTTVSLSPPCDCSNVEVKGRGTSSNITASSVGASPRREAGSIVTRTNGPPSSRVRGTLSSTTVLP